MQAKNVGNYHPALKKLFSSPASASASSYQLSNEARKPAAKRERGLSMGIGRHTSSGLKISREDIARVNATGSGNGGAGRRGGKGGKGKGK
ncbi:hypothetical protein DL93DRAFT_2088278 [Clavulina sp. PMI_390]|nr:hypothetical protein DL93DRAFT_2088278 [Clavulina sp. PMI_390]